MWARVARMRPPPGWTTTAAVLAAGFASSVLAARTLDPADRGRLALAFLIVSLVAEIAGVGLDQSLVYFSAQAGDRLVRRPGLVICFVSAVVGSVGVGLIAVAIGRETRLGAILVAFALWPAASLLLNLPQSVWQGTEEWSLFNGQRILIALAAPVGIAVAAVLAPRSVTAVALGQTVLLGFVALVSLQVWLRRRTTSHRGSQRGEPRAPDGRSMAAQLVAYGLAAVPGGVLWLLTTRGDFLILSWLTSPEQTGYYAAAVGVPSSISAFALTLGSYAFPRLARQGAQAGLRRTMARSLMPILVMGAGFAAMAPLLVPLLFGEEYRPAIPMAVLLGLAAVPLGGVLLVVDTLRGLGRPALSTAVLAVTGVCSMSFGALGTAMEGGTGMAAGSLVAYFGALGIAWIALGKALGDVVPQGDAQEQAS